MSSVSSKIKELVFECDTEQEALQLLQTYRRKNFHLVSKKEISKNDSTFALKLIKFRQPSNCSNLETVWEDFVNQMTDFGLENTFIVEVLNKIRDKDKYWEVHPEDHFRDIIMDARNFAKADDLAKVLVFVAPAEELLGFFCGYQKSLASIIKSIGAFVLASEKLKLKIKDLRISAQIQNLSFGSNSKITDFQKDIDNKVGLILITPEELNLISNEYFFEQDSSKKLSLILSSEIDLKTIAQLPSQKFLAGAYGTDPLSVDIFKVVNTSFKYNIPISFLWDGKNIGSILNPESQMLNVLDLILEQQALQHNNHK